MEQRKEELIREIHEKAEEQGVSLSSMGIETDEDLIELALKFTKANLGDIVEDFDDEEDDLDESDS